MAPRSGRETKTHAENGAGVGSGHRLRRGTDESWIYESDTDRGNQLAWAQPIGAADFIVR